MTEQKGIVTAAAVAERIRSSQQASISGKEPQAAYVHLPFCKKKCLYCDFPVVATGSRLDSPEVQDSMQAGTPSQLLVQSAVTPQRPATYEVFYNIPAQHVDADDIVHASRMQYRMLADMYTSLWQVFKGLIAVVQAYVDSILDEIFATAQITEQPLRTVFFGGGTPSLISPKQLDRVCTSHLVFRP